MSGFRRPGVVKRLSTRDLERRCLELKARGLSSTEVGEQLGIKPARVSRSLKRMETRSECLNDYEVSSQRRVELRTLELMQNAVIGQAIGDEVRIIEHDGYQIPVRMADDRKIEVVLKIMKRRSELLGLDAPKKIESKVEQIHAIDEQLEKLIREQIHGGYSQPGPGCEIPLALEAASEAGAIDAHFSPVDQLDDPCGQGVGLRVPPSTSE